MADLRGCDDTAKQGWHRYDQLICRAPAYRLERDGLMQDPVVLADCYARDSRNPSNASRWRGWRRAKVFNSCRSSGSIHS